MTKSTGVNVLRIFCILILKRTEIEYFYVKMIRKNSMQKIFKLIKKSKCYFNILILIIINYYKN